MSQGNYEIQNAVETDNIDVWHEKHEVVYIGFQGVLNLLFANASSSDVLRYCFSERSTQGN